MRFPFHLLKPPLSCDKGGRKKNYINCLLSSSSSQFNDDDNDGSTINISSLLVRVISVGPGQGKTTRRAPRKKARENVNMRKIRSDEGRL